MLQIPAIDYVIVPTYWHKIASILALICQYRGTTLPCSWQ